MENSCNSKNTKSLKSLWINEPIDVFLSLIVHRPLQLTQ